MNVRRLAAWVALPVALAVGVTACGSGKSGSGGSSSGGTVTLGIAEPEHLVPGNAVESNGFQVDSALFTPLVRFKDDGSTDYSQAAANSITSDDKKVWTVKLKPGMTFHNGQPVTADSYIKAWNYTAYGPNAQIGADPFFTRIQGYDDMQGTAPKAKELAGLKKVDDQTIQITLASPFVEFEKVLGYNVFDPLPDVAFNADGTLAKTYEDAPVGNGPFKMSGSWNHNQSINVVQYDGYTLDKPKVQEIDFKIYQDQDTMYNDLIAGNLDVQPQVPSDKLASAATDLGDRLQKSPSSYFGFISLPMYNTSWKNNLTLRQAISKAINRQEIVDKIFQGAYTPATSFVSPIVQGARDNTCGDACKFDPTAAKQLYTQSGGAPGNKIDLYYNADGGHKEWVDAVCNQLTKNLGVTCTGQPVAQFADLRKQARAHTLNQPLRGAWAFDYPSIEDYLTPLFVTNASSNDSGYTNSNLDAQMQKADQTTDEAKAITEYQKAEDMVAHDLPVIPMWFKQNIFGFSSNMKTVNVDLFANVDPLTLERN